MNSKDIFYKVALCFILIIFPLSGCVAKKTVKEDPFMEKWRTVAEKSKGYSPAAKRRVVDLSGKVIIPEHEAKEQEKKKKAEPEKPLPTGEITMKMHDIELPVLLRTLARAANQNIIINEKVKGRANINIKQAPWNQVFEAVLRTHGLAYGWEGEIIRIMTVEDMEHDLKIDAIKEKRQAQKIEMKRVEPLLTRVIHIDYADAAQLKESLKEFLTKDKDGKSRGSVRVDEHNNALIIQAIGEDIERMIPLIEEIDRAVPQILIEANIVETTKDTARSLGIQWGGMYAPRLGDHNLFVTPGGTGGTVGTNPLTSGGYSPAYGTAGISGHGYGINFPASAMSATGAGSLGLMFGTIGGNILEMQLNALQKDGKLNILSSPSITTLDNQTAFTENGEKVPYIVYDEAGNSTVKFEDVVLRLEITPHVIDGKNIKMEINIKKDEVDDTRNVQGNPYIFRKQTDTTLIVSDGETIVISGLSKVKKQDKNSGIPGLKNIPVLGWLFKNKYNSEDMEEVLIFITPHILKEKIMEPGRDEQIERQPQMEESLPETTP